MHRLARLVDSNKTKSYLLAQKRKGGSYRQPCQYGGRYAEHVSNIAASQKRTTVLYLRTKEETNCSGVWFNLVTVV